VSDLIERDESANRVSDASSGRHARGRRIGTGDQTGSTGAVQKTVIGYIEDRIFQPRYVISGGVALFVCYVAVFASYIRYGNWLFDAGGAVNFVDFISFWVNARFALSEAAAQAYDYATFAAAQVPYVAVTRGAYPYFHLVYPPTLFPLIAPLGLQSYAAAFTTWMASTAALYLFSIHKIIPRKLVFLFALVPYAVPANLYIGQTGFLVAGLLGLSLSLMARRPFLAGLCLGLLTCKPQYGIIFPIVLLATGQWRMIAGACVMVVGLAASVTVAYGTGIWRAYAGAFGTSSLDNFMTDDVLDAIDQTVFGVMHWFGAGFAMKWAVHLIAAVLVTVLVCVICRHPVSSRLKAAAIAIGALTATPYMLAYDLIALTIPAAFLAQEGWETGFLRGERVTLLGCFVALFLMRQMPVGPVILAALMVVVLRRVFRLPLAVRSDDFSAVPRPSIL
jgi:arabinofuranan 3-O-arabinosyltransferase